MIHIDGSIGEGGGQILRTALGLSMVTGQAFGIEKIRAGREKPGLLRQHLTAVNAAAEICDAAVDGAVISSRTLSFSPGKVKSGDYTFAVGSAGSTTLVLQAVLPALLRADGPSTITLEGGTHNMMAPPFDFLQRAFLPLVNRMGVTVDVTLERAGFYPAGGGRFVTAIQPAAALSPLVLNERGQIKRKLATATVAGLSGDIAKRELDKVRQMLGWSEDEVQIRQLPDAWGPGNILTLEIESENVTELFTGFGTKGTSAEAVANGVAREVRGYLADGVPVGQHLADQILIPMALAGEGSFTTQSLTDHTTTNITVIEKFLPVQFSVTARGADRHQITVARRVI
jgi:RNA 3'-terminal phosphate cyclase (ATP)